MTYPRFSQFKSYESLGGKKAPASDTFSPTKIPNLVAWFDARRITSIVKDGNDKVSQWDDVRGPSFGSFTQGVANSQPLFVASGFDGKPYIRFDGIDDYLEKASTYTEINADFTAFQKIQRISGSSELCYLSVGKSTQDGFHSFTGIFGFTNTRQIEFGGDTGVGSALTGTFNEEVWAWDWNGVDTAELYVDDSLIKTQSTGYNAPTGGAHIGAADNLSSGIQQFANINIQEFIFYNRQLTNSERSQVNQYLMRTL